MKMQAYLCWKELTHGVMGDILAQAVELLLGTKVSNDPESVGEELVVKQPVAQSHREDNAYDVHYLTEAKPKVILGIPDKSRT